MLREAYQDCAYTEVSSQKHRSTSNSMPWVWDYFSTYRLSEDDLKAFLTELFGQHEFSISASNGNYAFTVPRCLNIDERNKLEDRRWTTGQ
ncbi:uncharacterized protein BDR25DRAFT_128497 [Lindgomyces ingoldianus]|uniref:Uncharacterized protein n=1 Tax=Lindgomyces ingoldianus TaxID=673940 RepID=A0ACB6R455_9PLEO|nr:uncharacterized protein BDR25DRAFT_128497 [Lindgomyces ingoldianus]KAF2473092.1 hypothetical protein BDR25DRAFT_128497 [Lindgomyces ingoldianus]